MKISTDTVPSPFDTKHGTLDDYNMRESVGESSCRGGGGVARARPPLDSFCELRQRTCHMPHAACHALPSPPSPHRPVASDRAAEPSSPASPC